MRANVFAVACCIAAAGCANLSTVDRRSELPKRGVAVHLDAQQRLTFASGEGFVCAEPSPDALQAYASSLGAGFAAPTKESLSLAASLASNAGSIGLRTQSITLMRDALFRICELYYNKAISKAAAVQLLQRSQDLTLGVLAIEQLTGAVVAQQVKLAGSGGANAAATINDTTRELDRAKKDLEAKKKAADAAAEAADAQAKVVAQKKAAADAAKEKAAGVQKQIDALAPKLADAESLHEQNTAKVDELNLEVQVNEVLLAGLGPEKEALEAKKKELAGSKAKAQEQHDAAADADKPPLKAKLEELTKQAAATQAKLDAIPNRKKAYEDAKKAASDKLPAAEDTAAKSAAALEKPRKAMAILKAAPEYVAQQSAAAALKAATDDETAKKSAAEAAKTSVAEASDAVGEIAKVGDMAKANAGSTASGTAEFSPVTQRYGVSKETAAVLAQATHAIVETVMNKGHMTDTCGVLLMADGNTVNEAVLKLCTQVVLETLQVWKADAQQNIACKQAGTCAEPGGQAVPFAVPPRARAVVAPGYKPYSPSVPQ